MSIISFLIVRNEKPTVTTEKKEVEEFSPIKRAITEKVNAIMQFTAHAMPLIKSGVSI